MLKRLVSSSKKNIQWWWSRYGKTIEKPSMAMVPWKKKHYHPIVLKKWPSLKSNIHIFIHIHIHIYIYIFIHISGASSSWSYKPLHGVCIMITMSKTTKLAKFWVNCSILTEVGNKSCIFWHIGQFSIDSDRCWIKGLNEDLQISLTHGRNTMHIYTWR